MLSAVQKTKLINDLSTAKTKTEIALASSDSSLQTANYHNNLAKESHNKVVNCMDNNLNISKQVDASVNNNTWLDIVLAVPTMLMNNPVHAGLALGGLITAGLIYKKFGDSAGVTSNAQLSAPTTTNITINNITKSMEDL